MEATVLPLSWPAGFDPIDHKRFETNARTLRYQALGRACRAARINKLYVAHHADDQAETVLMRLANNRLRSGMQDMQPIEWIPECFGIHGVSHSGSCREDLLPEHMPFPIEDGGVRILRPLLGFDKSRLIATCECHGVIWAEDKTNHLQTYTSRNAIRHMLKNHQLPAALSIKSLVDISLHMQKRVHRHKDRAQLLLGKCLKQLDLQAGSLLMRFPPFQELLDRPIKTRSDVNEAKNTANYLLAGVGQLIAPRETPPLGELVATVGNIWPEFAELEDTNSPHAGFSGNKTNYCIYGIWWRKWNRPSPFQRSSQKSHSSAHPHSHEWFLTRQPLEHHRTGVSSGAIQYPSRNLSLKPSNEGEDEYRLFDGRWWLSIQNHCTDVLTLRLFTKEDIHHIPSLHNARRSGPSPERFIATALSLLKPADLRFTLPAVFRHNKITKEETLVGFPTLDVSMGQLGYPKDVCSWQVRYKKVELSTKQMGASVVRGITHAMIEKEMAKFDKNFESPPSLPRKREAAVKKVAKDKGTTRKIEAGIMQGHKRMVRGQAVQGSHEAGPGTAGKKPTAQAKTIPLVPVAESQRQGWSEKREGGGYNIRWGDFKDRFS